MLDFNFSELSGPFQKSVQDNIKHKMTTYFIFKNYKHYVLKNLTKPEIDSRLPERKHYKMSSHDSILLK